MKKRFTLLFAALLAFVGVAKADAAYDGIYTIGVDADIQRGYIAAGKGYADYPVLSGITLSGYTQNDTEAVENGKNWYFTSIDEGASYYIYNVAVGKFLVGTGSQINFGDEPYAWSIKANGDYVNIMDVAHPTKALSGGCGRAAADRPIAYDTNINDGGAKHTLNAVADGKTTFATEIAAAEAAIEALMAKFVTVTYKYVYGTTVWKTETVRVTKGEAYPVATTAPYGVTYTFPSETVSEDLAEGAVVEVTCASSIAYAKDFAGVEQWYYMNIHADGYYLYYEAGAKYIDLTKTTVDADNKDAYTWAFVGDPFNGFMIVNKLAGKGMILSSSETTTDGQTGATVHPIMTSTPVPDGNNTYWMATASTNRQNGFYLEQKGHSSNKMNRRSDKLAYWNGGADGGSAFVVELRKPIIAYTLTDELGNTYTGTYEGIAGTDLPVLSGAAGCTFSDVEWDGAAVTAKVAFPFPISNAETTNATMISSFKNSADNFLWRAVETDVTAQKGAEADSDNYKWAIYPKHADGKFTFTIKNLGVGKYIYSESTGNSDAQGAVTLADEGSEFTLDVNNQFKLATGKYLSLGTTSHENEQYVGTWSSHLGTENKFIACEYEAPVDPETPETPEEPETPVTPEVEAFLAKYSELEMLTEACPSMYAITAVSEQFFAVYEAVSSVKAAIEDGTATTEEVVAATASMTEVIEFALAMDAKYNAWKNELFACYDVQDATEATNPAAVAAFAAVVNKHAGYQWNMTAESVEDFDALIAELVAAREAFIAGANEPMSPEVEAFIAKKGELEMLAEAYPSIYFITAVNEKWFAAQDVAAALLEALGTATAEEFAAFSALVDETIAFAMAMDTKYNAWKTELFACYDAQDNTTTASEEAVAAFAEVVEKHAGYQWSMPAESVEDFDALIAELVAAREAFIADASKQAFLAKYSELESLTEAYPSMYAITAVSEQFGVVYEAVSSVKAAIEGGTATTEEVEAAIASMTEFIEFVQAMDAKYNAWKNELLACYELQDATEATNPAAVAAFAAVVNKHGMYQWNMPAESVEDFDALIAELVAAREAFLAGANEPMSPEVEAFITKYGELEMLSEVYSSMNFISGMSDSYFEMLDAGTAIMATLGTVENEDLAAYITLADEFIAFVQAMDAKYNAWKAELFACYEVQDNTTTASEEAVAAFAEVVDKHAGYQWSMPAESVEDIDALIAELVAAREAFIAAASGINYINADVEAVIYDIHGRRVSTMEKGIYIVNGRKVIVK